jgi:cell division inhibitor SepF
MSIKNIFDRFFYLEDEDFEEEAQNNPKKTQDSRQQSESVQQPVKPSRVKKERRTTTVAETANNVVSLSAATSTKSSKVVLVEPRVYAEAQDIAENLKNKRATIVNLQRIDREQAIRIIDFLSGTVYALGGEIQRVGTNIFLCTPDNVEVSGEISDYLLEDI